MINPVCQAFDAITYLSKQPKYFFHLFNSSNDPPVLLFKTICMM